METKTFVLDEVRKANIATKNGNKEIYYVKVRGKSASSFVGEWNKNWKAGDTVKAVVKKTVKDGKTYINLKCPPELKTFSRGELSPVDKEQLKRIEDKVDSILNILKTASESDFDEFEGDFTTYEDESLSGGDFEAFEGELKDTGDDVKFDDNPF